MRSLLIDDTTLKENSAIDVNVQAQYIHVAITKAQEIELQTLIGTYLLDTLCTKKDNDELADEYLTLYDEYIVPFLINMAMANIQKTISYKTRNEGVVTTGSDNSVQQALNEVHSMEQEYKNMADFYANRMTDWLCANSSAIAEWGVCRTCADMPSRPGGYTTGMYLGGTKSCGCDH